VAGVLESSGRHDLQNQTRGSAMRISKKNRYVRKKNS